MSKQVGIVFADYCEAGSAPLHYQAALSVQSGLSEEQVAGYLYTYHTHTPTTRFISSPEMANLIDAEVQYILNEGHETARALLTEHITQLSRLAQALMEHEQLDRTEFEEVLQQ
jgi:ATP-dependent Zn protease